MNCSSPAPTPQGRRRPREGLDLAESRVIDIQEVWNRTTYAFSVRLVRFDRRNQASSDPAGRRSGTPLNQAPRPTAGSRARTGRRADSCWAFIEHQQRGARRAGPWPSRPRHRRSRHGLMVEPLEERALLSTFTVNDLGDTGAGSGLTGDLRYCITQANEDLG